MQALPDPPRRTAIRNVARLVAPGGTLIVIAARREHTDDVRGPPWPLTSDEIDAFAAGSLTPVCIEALTDPRPPHNPRWRAEIRRQLPVVNTG
ncbi:MAG TPA: hypothetical protein VGJ95_22510 [Pseudonocardiaceae bacterium]